MKQGINAEQDHDVVLIPELQLKKLKCTYAPEEWSPDRLKSINFQNSPKPQTQLTCRVYHGFKCLRMYHLYITIRPVDRHPHDLSHIAGLINVQLNYDIADAIRPRRKRTLGQNVVPALG